MKTRRQNVRCGRPVGAVRVTGNIWRNSVGCPVGFAKVCNISWLIHLTIWFIVTRITLYFPKFIQPQLLKHI